MGRLRNIGREHLALADIVQMTESDVELAIDTDAREAVINCRNYLERRLASGSELFYGINTGFGSQYNVRIDNNRIHQLQHNLILSHAAGAGEKVDSEISRAMLLLKIVSLCKGHSAVRLELIEQLVTYFNHSLHPVVYKMGSLGASGDLAPLAHMSLTLLGMGAFQTETGEIDAGQVLKELGIGPIKLQAKEGIALINGTQFSLSHGILAWRDADRLLQQSHKVAAMSLVAFQGNRSPFHALIQLVRGHEGQLQVAGKILNLLGGANGEPSDVQLQDPYSFRCIPQVHGAVWEALRYTGEVLEAEANAVTDNPIVFPEQDQIISGGNFHAQPIAFILDHLAVAISGLGNISERRTYKLLSGTRGLKPCLIDEHGYHSGLMIAQYTAASIANRNKVLCYPASADSIPSSMGQEDHVSMAANSGTKLREVVANCEMIVAIELICAAQALDLTGRKDALSEELKSYLESFREFVPYLKHDVTISDLIVEARDFLRLRN